MYPDGAPELLTGCVDCKSRFFFFIKKENLKKVKLPELTSKEADQVEKDIRKIIGVEDDDKPIVLDLETVQVIKPGKYVIDLVKAFSESGPVIYKLKEGKYMIDLTPSK
ncbi:MAG: hypothetical protein GOU97_02110 [Nanoarchaeota archaeon]|nr:hypothetical protein [Nanoarchaeota archaeon]